MNTSTILLFLALAFMLIGVVYIGLYFSKKSAQKYREKLEKQNKDHE
jgi:uncharacterized protein YneF (UPF0154 family)